MEGYEKIRKIGSGAMGVCWLVRRKLDGGQVVAKEISVGGLSEKDQTETMQEVEVLKKLQHPNIISLHHAFLHQKSLYIVMEHADAGDLAAVVKKGKRLPEAKILSYFAQICAGLAHVHSLNILHRDLKTANILLNHAGQVKLGDFGIARVMTDTGDMAKTMIGTPYYLSPEICEDKPYNRKSDVWAVGCVLYELSTLRRPFEAATLPAIVLKIVRGSYPPVPTSFSPQFRSLVARILTRNPDDRPEVTDMMEMPLVSSHLRSTRSSANAPAPSRRPPPASVPSLNIVSEGRVGTPPPVRHRPLGRRTADEQQQQPPKTAPPASSPLHSSTQVQAPAQAPARASAAAAAVSASAASAVARRVTRSSTAANSASKQAAGGKGVAQKAFGPVEGPGGGDWHAEMQAKIFAVNDGLQKAEADRKQKRVSEGGAGRQPEADQEGLAMLGGEEVDWGDWMDVWSKDKETAEEEGAPGGDQRRSIGSEAAPGNAAAKGRVAEKAGARAGAGVGAGGGIGERGGGGGGGGGSAARPEWQGVLDVPKRVPGLGSGPRANAPAASPRKETPTGRGVHQPSPSPRRGVQQPSPSPRREVGGGRAGGGGGRLGLGIGAGDARSAARGGVGRESGGGGAVARGASPGVEVASRRISYSLQEAKANEAEYKAKIKGAKSKLSKADCLFSPRGGQERDKGSRNAGLVGGGGGGGGGLGGGGGGPLMTGGGVAFTVEAGQGDGGGGDGSGGGGDGDDGDDASSRMRMRMRMRGGGSGANQQPVGAHHDAAAAGEGGRRQAKGGIAFDLDMFEAPGVGSGGRETPSPSHQGWADGKAARRLASPGGVLPRQIGAGSAARPPKSPVGVMPRASKAPLPSPQVGSRASKGAATTPAESPAPPGGPGAGVGDSPSVRGKAKRASLSDVIRKGREQRRESGSVEPEIEVRAPTGSRPPFPQHQGQDHALPSVIEKLRMRCEDALGLSLFLTVYERVRSGGDAADLIPKHLLDEGSRPATRVLVDIGEIIKCEDRVYNR